MKKRLHYNEENTVPSRYRTCSHFGSCEQNLRITLHSPYLDLNDYSLFNKLKFDLKGKFSSNEEIITTVNTYYSTKDAKYCLEVQKRLQHHCEKCIDLKGNYTEK